MTRAAFFRISMPRVLRPGINKRFSRYAQGERAEDLVAQRVDEWAQARAKVQQRRSKARADAAATRRKHG